MTSAIREPHSKSSAPESIVRAVIARWRGGDRPDAAGFLSANPTVQERKSLAMDLIYEEYCLRHESGETLVPSTFCQKFPAYKQSLQRLLDVHQFLREHPEEEWKWPEPGDNILGFQVVEQLGSGAIARVYLAQQPALGQRHVVVKVSRHGANEAKLLGKLEHPSIVPIHSVHQDAATGLTCICMPFLGTATLVDLLDLAFSKGKPPASAEVVLSVARQYRPLGVREADEPEALPILRRGTYVEGVIQIGVQLAEGLAAAHDSGVMHRDIKPSNVLLARSGRAMLLDFNLSTDLEMPLERVGGTVAYMAPERIRCLVADDVRSESKIDPRGDVYSLGALLYELLCGDLPSRPQNVAPGKQPRLEDWLKCRLTPPVGLSDRNPDVDRCMEQTVLRALSPEPAQRYASAGEFAVALQSCLALKPRAARWLRRNRRTALLTGLCLAAATAAGAGIWASQPSLEERLFSQGEAAYARGDSQTAIDCFTRALQRQPDSLQLLFARGQSYRQAEDYLLAKRDFQSLFDKSSDPQFLMLVAFCELKQGSFNPARGNYEKAINRGYSTPQLRHNLAYCMSRTLHPKQAVLDLGEVLKMDPNLPLTYHLRGRLQFSIANSDRKPVPASAKEDMRRALEGIDNEPLLHLDAACIFACSAKENPSDHDEALKQLRKAVQAGISKTQLETEKPFLGSLSEELSPQEMEQIERTPRKLLSTPLYYEPGTDIRLPLGA